MELPSWNQVIPTYGLCYCKPIIGANPVNTTPVSIPVPIPHHCPVPISHQCPVPHYHGWVVPSLELCWVQPYCSLCLQLCVCWGGRGGGHIHNTRGKLIRYSDLLVLYKPNSLYGPVWCWYCNIKVVLLIIITTLIRWITMFGQILIVGLHNYSTKAAPTNIDYSDSSGMVNKNLANDSVTTEE